MKTRLLYLQKQYEEGLLNEEDISPEDIKMLHKLYDKQIKELKESTMIYKEKITKIKNKIKD